MTLASVVRSTPVGLLLTSHALEAMLARQVSPAEVDRVVADAEVSYRTRKDGADRTVYQRGDLAVVTARHGVDVHVITVLYRTFDRYASEDEQTRPSGRSLFRGQRRRLTADLRHAREAS